MEIYHVKAKKTHGWGYWGDYGEIPISLSKGEVRNGETMPLDPLHYWKTSTQYFLILDGKGVIEVEGKEIEVFKEQLLRINPGEKYRMVKAIEFPFSWIVYGTIKEPMDKVIVEE